MPSTEPNTANTVRAQASAAAASLELNAPDEPAATNRSYSASGRVTLQRPTALRLHAQETRELPGTFGDPFRVLEALPGVVPYISGLPYVYVRGAPPAGTVYYYDGIQVPGLFHLALGPAVVHPSLIDDVDFYAGVAPGRYGRYTGGVLSGGPSTRAAPTRLGGELELRLIDINGRLDIPLGGGSLSVSGRYGYPGPLVSLFSPSTSLAYWDYQIRLILPIALRTRFELVWLGSYDSATTQSSLSESRYVLGFHRAEARLIHRVGATELGALLQFGVEESQIDLGLRVRSLRIGPRLYAAYAGSSGVRARVGAEMFGYSGHIHAESEIQGGPIQLRLPFIEDVAARSVMSAYAELSVPWTERMRAELGLRSDVWLTGARAEAAVDPRLTLSYRSSEDVTWHVALGLAHQPAVFLLPLPGISDVGLEHGLQSAIQSEAGVAVALPAAFKFESQVYAQRLSNAILPDLVLDQTDSCAGLPESAAAATPRCSDGYPRSQLWAYGLELFLRRDVSEVLSGWINYTLGWARARDSEGKRFSPTFDVRHVLNLVLQYRLPKGFSAGARVQYRSGKIATELFQRAQEIVYQQRLPSFFRADLQLGYSFRPRWGSLRVSLEWFNVTLSREATDIVCHDGVGIGVDPTAATPCGVQRAPALFFPNLGVRAEF